MVKGVRLADSDDKTKKIASDSEDETKVEDSVELSLDELDQVLSQEDPEFVASLNEVAQGPFDIDLLDESKFKYTFEVEKKAWAQKKGLPAKLYKFFPPVALLSFLFFVIKNFLFSKIQFLKIQSLFFVKELLPLTKKHLKRLAQNFKHLFQVLRSQFQGLSKPGKVVFVALTLASIVGFSFSLRILFKGLFPPSQPLFLTSLDSYATEVISFDPHTEIESFYDSTRAVQNVFALRRIVVNIKRSASSGDNPMAAFEFIVEGSSTEAVIEVKDREAEVRDLFQRVIEEMSFDQLASTEGKKALTDTLRRSTNQLLTEGKLRRVFIKTAIVKP